MSYFEWATWVALIIIAALITLTMFAVLVIMTRPKRLVDWATADNLDRLTSAFAAYIVTGVLVAVLLVIASVFHADWFPVAALAAFFASAQYNRLRTHPRTMSQVDEALRERDNVLIELPRMRKPDARSTGRTGANPHRTGKDWTE